MQLQIRLTKAAVWTAIDIGPLPSIGHHLGSITVGEKERNRGTKRSGATETSDAPLKKSEIRLAHLTKKPCGALKGSPMDTGRQRKLMVSLVEAEDLQAVMSFKSIVRLAFQHLGSGFPDLKHVCCALETPTAGPCVGLSRTGKGTWASRRAGCAARRPVPPHLTMPPGLLEFLSALISRRRCRFSRLQKSAIGAKTESCISNFQASGKLAKAATSTPARCEPSFRSTPQLLSHI